MLNLLATVRREAFVPDIYHDLAFCDTELPLPNGENMLSPKVEARILQALSLQKHETALEIGAGSGYMAALLAYQGKLVKTVEIDAVLFDLAQKNLMDYGIVNAEVIHGNGLEEHASLQTSMLFDVIVLSGSLPVLPELLLQKLKMGGRLFAVIGIAPTMSAQLITRTAEQNWQTVTLFETNIRPLQGYTLPSRFIF